MGRRRSGGRSSSRRGFSTSAFKSPPPTPTTRRCLSFRSRSKRRVLGAPPPAEQRRGGLFSGLAGMMAQGAALGTGSAMAHRAIDSVMGGREDHGAAPEAAAATYQPGDVCFNQSKAFTDCITANNGDMGACQFYFDMLQQCKQQQQL